MLPESRAAGVGKLTAALVAGGWDVDAIEPGVRVHAGQGEQLPLPDGSVDAVGYGQA